MFRKPKKVAKKAGIRRRQEDDDEDGPIRKRLHGADDNDDEEEESTSALLSEAKKRTQKISGKAAPVVTSETSGTNKEKNVVMHQYSTNDVSGGVNRRKDLVTSTVEIHSEKQQEQHQGGAAERGEDGIFRDKTRSKLLAGPIKATTHIRTTCRFDYQPDICKDYKETGFCGFGDTCIYLHDRGDTLTGWQLEQQWEEEQKKKKEQQEKEIQGFLDASNGNNNNGVDENNDALSTDDGIPYACYICRKHFNNPVVTSCNHYFCEPCIMQKIRSETESCPICGKDTHGVFNKPTKLLSKRRRVLGTSAASKENAWEEFAKAFQKEE